MGQISAHPLRLWWIFISLCGLRCVSISLSLDPSHAQGSHNSTGQLRGCGPNLAVFFDGSLFTKGQMCSEAQLHVADDDDRAPKQHGDHHNCESNIPVMFRLVEEAKDMEGQDGCPKGQLALYVDGVGRDATDDFKSGKGTWDRALDAYTWLSEHYDGTNKIFVFGASRGGLSARMLQGLIHKFGLAHEGVTKKDVPFVEQVTQASPFRLHDAGISRNFRNNEEKSWSGVKIAHMGLLETVLRSLSDDIEHASIKALGMRMSEIVEHASVALALDDARMVYETHELAMDPATKAKQVWFSGQHRDVMGGFPMYGLARIVAGWTLDNAEENGLLLPSGWRERPTMKGDYMEYAGFTAGFGVWSEVIGPGVTLETDYRYAKVKNPNQCQETNRRVLMHQSVKDRMEKNKGYVPQPFCCRKEGYDLGNIEYVSNEHYKYWQNKASDHPTWFKISFGELTVDNPYNDKDFFLRVTTWSDRKVKETRKKGKIREFKGHSTIVTHKVGDKEKNHQDFSKKPVILPWLYATTRLLVEVDQKATKGIIYNGPQPYIGRVEIRLEELKDVDGNMKEYEVVKDPPKKKKKKKKKTNDDVEKDGVANHFGENEEGENDDGENDDGENDDGENDDGENDGVENDGVENAGMKQKVVGSLQVQVETLKDDADAKVFMPDTEPAMCQWLEQHSGLKWKALCHNKAVDLSFWGFNENSARNCEDFFRDTTTGNRTATLGKERWQKQVEDKNDKSDNRVP